MTDQRASRTLVKSVPELWAECSDASSLAKHLRAFGEIRITELEPESAVAWEGTAACGTVRLEPSGWGTRVVIRWRRAPVPAESAPLAEGEGSADELDATLDSLGRAHLRPYSRA